MITFIRSTMLVKPAAHVCVRFFRRSEWKITFWAVVFNATVHAGEIAVPAPVNQAWLQAQSAFIVAGRSTTPKPDDWLAVADKMRAVQTGTPAPREASEAKTYEALALIKVAELGGPVSTDAVSAAVASVKSDASLPEENRFAVASRFRELQIEQTGKLDIAQRMADYDSSDRSMIAEFPGREDPYTALAALAEEQPDPVVAEKIVTDFAEDQQAPQKVRARLDIVRRRDALVGTLVDWNAFGLGEEASGKLKDRPMLICTQTPERADSLAMTEWLTQNVPNTVVLATFDLKTRKLSLRDPAIRKKTDVSVGPAANSALLAERLLLDRAPMIYLIDSTGRIRFVRALQDLPAKLRAVEEMGQ